MKRRNFLKSSGTLSVGMGLSPGFAARAATKDVFAINAAELKISPFMNLKNPGKHVVRWTHGLWADKFGLMNEINIPYLGGDLVMLKQLFVEPDMPDPFGLQAGIRDGVMSILIGIAARKSIAEGKPLDIEGLTDLTPMAKRPA